MSKPKIIEDIETLQTNLNLVDDTVALHLAEDVTQGSPHGLPSVISGSKVIHIPTPSTTATLFTIAELRGAFNNYNATTDQYFGIVNNGDAGVSVVHMDGVSWSGANMQVVFDRSIEGYIRVNYMVFHQR